MSERGAMTGGTALVTGGAGFLGRHLVAQLAAAGTAVRVLDPAAARTAFPPGVEAVAGSVCDPATVARAMEGVDTVFHMAGVAHLWARDPEAFTRVNLEGTRTVLRAARRATPARIVVTSSALTLIGRGHAAPSPVTEDSPRPPLSAMVGAYARSKWRAETEARRAAAAGLPVIVVHPTAPLGPGDDALTPPTRMLRGFLGGRIPAYLDCRLNLVGVADVARGHVLAAAHGTPGRHYILGGENLCLSTFLRLLEEVSGQPMPRRRIAYPVALAAAAAAEWWAGAVSGRPPQATRAGVRLTRLPLWVDSGRAARELGYHPAPLRDSVAAAVAWLRQHPGVAG